MLLQVLGQGLERRLLRGKGRVLLRALRQGPYKGLGLPELSGGRQNRQGEVKRQNAKCKVQNGRSERNPRRDSELGREGGARPDVRRQAVSP